VVVKRPISRRDMDMLLSKQDPALTGAAGSNEDLDNAITLTRSNIKGFESMSTIRSVNSAIPLLEASSSDKLYVTPQIVSSCIIHNWLYVFLSNFCTYTIGFGRGRRKYSRF
jgi:hypothetical protein